MDKKKVIKVIVFIISVFLFTNCFYKQTEIDCNETNRVKGIFVIKYIKSEIESYNKNQILQQEGKIHESIIDFDKESFFVSEEDTVENYTYTIQNWNPFRQTDIYFLPINSRLKSYLQKFCPDKIGLIELEDFSNQKNCIYYTLRDDETHLYNIYFIEGKEIKMGLENNEINKLKLDLSDEVDKSASSFKVHFIYAIERYTCDYDLDGFETWKNIELP